MTGDVRPQEVWPLAHQIISQRRCTIPLAIQLQVLNLGRKKLDGLMRCKLFQKVASHTATATGLKLPNRILVRISSMQCTDPTLILRPIRELFHSLPIPAELRRYLSDALHLVHVRAPTITDIVGSRGIKVSLAQARELSLGPCKCKNIARTLGIPLVEGHCVFREPAHIHAVFKEQAPLILQNASNDTAPTWNQIHKDLVGSLRKALLAVPSDIALKAKASTLYSDVLTAARMAW